MALANSLSQEEEDMVLSTGATLTLVVEMEQVLKAGLEILSVLLWVPSAPAPSACSTVCTQGSMRSNSFVVRVA